jgi:uncharacterized protein (UPF0297 family)
MSSSEKPILNLSIPTREVDTVLLANNKVLFSIALIHFLQLENNIHEIIAAYLQPSRGKNSFEQFIFKTLHVIPADDQTLEEAIENAGRNLIHQLRKHDHPSTVYAIQLDPAFIPHHPTPEARSIRKLILYYSRSFTAPELIRWYVRNSEVN